MEGLHLWRVTYHDDLHQLHQLHQRQGGGSWSTGISTPSCISEEQYLGASELPPVFFGFETIFLGHVGCATCDFVYAISAKDVEAVKVENTERSFFFGCHNCSTHFTGGMREFLSSRDMDSKYEGLDSLGKLFVFHLGFLRGDVR